MWNKCGINRNFLNRKSYSRNTTLRQSLHIIVNQVADTKLKWKSVW